MSLQVSIGALRSMRENMSRQVSIGRVGVGEWAPTWHRCAQEKVLLALSLISQQLYNLYHSSLIHHLLSVWGNVSLVQWTALIKSNFSWYKRVRVSVCIVLTTKISSYQ